jgi:hypothetical protein
VQKRESSDESVNESDDGGESYEESDESESCEESESSDDNYDSDEIVIPPVLAKNSKSKK